MFWSVRQHATFGKDLNRQLATFLLGIRSLELHGVIDAIDPAVLEETFQQYFVAEV